ncbi:MAG: stage II sporulation protein P, partial [Clostridium sp.]
KEISFLNYNNLALKDSDVQEQAQAVNNIVINPFKINDGSINKIDNSVNIIGNPEDNSKKKILIYHTHTNEAYAEGNTGLESTVAAVGDTLTEELEKQGFTVIHDKTVHDVADYNKAYNASRETLSKYLDSYGDFDLIIDLHRDDVPNKAAVTASIEGNDVAKLMFVAANMNPRFAAQNQIIESMVSIANGMYPGLFRTKYLYTYEYGIVYYSQDLSDNAILLEVGANTNNLQEAKNSMVYMSRVIAQHLNSK